MATQTITTDLYQLYPSPRNTLRTVFGHQLFLPHPYALIHLPDFHLEGKATLFAACRLADQKMGQLVTFELPQDQERFERQFTPD
ncbi:hypothetical protein [Diaphorobacter sp.]|uniref:hypothetical protein n=1 Tax=Diaphorobacter sp. TaxID=1934310 RepID=UPI00258C36B8|nr:hypothetical protein [Diaphorobacter sp.]